MKCKRLCAWLLSLVMMFSLLPVSAAAVKWYDKHSVTVKYEFKDDSSKSKPDYVIKTIASHVGAITPYRVEEPGYNHSAKVTSGNAECSIDAGFLHVKHVDADSVITVTYTPKGNVITIDQYYNNGTILAKWGTNIKVNGLDIVENNKLEKGAIIDNTELTDATEKYRFLTVGGKTYDFSYARQIPYPGASSSIKLTDVWYERDTGEWYYAHFNNTKVLLGNKSGVNFCYNVPHTVDSAHHQFDQFVETVDPTCTKQGYTVYKCAYCTETEKREYTGPLKHDWKWVHDDTTSGADSKHYQVCQRKGCNATSTPVGCNFVDTSIETGTKHTCTVCGYSYTDEITPTGTPVYVYFQTVNTAGEPIENVKGVTPNGNKGGWATLGKLVTATNVATASAEELGNEVKDDPNTNFERYKVNGNVINGNVGISLIDWESIVLEHNGAAGYESEAPYGTDAWHLNGKVKVYKLSYNANLPGGVTASVTVPDPAYYLPNATVSTDDPTLQGYNFEGWYTEETFEHKVEKTVTVSKDTVLYAKWTPAQPTTDFGSVVITTTKPELKETVDLSGGAYEVPYTATYTMSNKLLRMLQAAPSGVPMTFVVELDSRLTAKKDAATDKFLYDFDGAGILEVDESKIMVSSDGHTITVVCKPTADWKKALEGKTPVVMKLDGTGVLAATDFAVGEYLSTKGHIEGKIPVGGTPLPVMILANDCRTKMTAQTYTVTYTDGAGGAAFNDKTYSNILHGAPTPAFGGTPERDGYTFNGWKPAVDKTVTKDATYTATWTRNSSRDDDDKYFFAIQKVDAQDGHALNGAKFELYQLDKNDRIVNRRVVRTTQQSNKNGIALFSVDNKKSYDGIWYYAEVSAPEGYVLDRTEYEINDKDFSDSLSTAVKYADTVRNYRGTTPDLLNDSDHFAYVIGYMDGNVRPYGLISRAETTTIFFRLLKDSVRDGNLLTSNTYTDVADDYWANTAISTMTGLGIVQGRSTTTFDPKAPITRAQFAAICARFDTGKSSGEQTFTDIKSHWAEKYIQRAAELGWIKGFEDGTFRPDTYITRAQAMTMINRVLNRIPEDESDLLPGMNVWPDCNPGDWFYLAIQEATNSHDYRHKAGSYETWTGLNADPDWTRYEN